MALSSEELRAEAFVQVTEAIESIDWILASHGFVTKAIDPLTKPGITQIAARLSNAIRGATGPVEADALAGALRALDVDWVALDAKARERVIQTAKRALSKNLAPRALPRVKEKIDVGVRGTYSRSKRASVTQHKLDVPFTMSILDTRIARHVSDSQLNFIRDQYGATVEGLGQKVRDVVAAGAKRGASSREIVKDIRAQVKGLDQLGRGPSYWEMVSLSFVNRARTYAQLSGFREAGFQRYVWESVLDEVTTETCRFMHGKTFPVDGAMKTFESAEAQTSNPQALKTIQPWISQGVTDDDRKSPILFYRGTDGEKVVVADIDEAGRGVSDRIGDYWPQMTDDQLLGNGLSLPPIHGLCRSTVLPDTTTPPRTLPGVSAPPAIPPAIPGQPRPRAPKVPTKGRHFEHFVSDLDREIEQEVLAMIDDLGGLEALRKNPLGRLVFSTRSLAQAEKWDDFLPDGAGGAWFNDWMINGKTVERAVIKIKSDPSKVVDPKLSISGPAPRTVTASLKRPVDKLKSNLAHEYGHHIHKSGMSNVDGNVIRPTREQMRRELAVKRAWKKHRIAVREGRALPITQYAEQDSNEFFAEAFTYHAIAPEILRARNPIAFDMVEEVRAMAGLDPVNAARVAMIEKADTVAKASPDYSKLFEVTRETERLFDTGKLTVAKLDEMEAKARKVDQGFGEWIEAFSRYRDSLTMPERMALKAASL